MMTGPRVGWFGDDFTGASDTLGTYAEAGISAALLTRIATPQQLERLGPVVALGLAGKTRALDREAMVEALAPVGPFFAGLGIRLLHYKCCSTFDSAPDIGNLSVAINALRPSFPTPTLPIVGGQPNLRRYCLFGHLFAAAGQAGAVFRIDRHPTMSRHPVTPMEEADLARHLQRLGMGAITNVPYPAMALGEAASLFAEAAARGDDAVLLDVSRTEDLDAIGNLLWQEASRRPLLALGASGVAQALLPALSKSVHASASRPRVEGPAFVLVGSLSPVTRAQVDAAPSYDKIEIDPERLVVDDLYAGALAGTLVARLGERRHTMALTREVRSEAVTNRQVAIATAALADRVLTSGAARKACIAGGDTSSFFMGVVDGWALRHLGNVGPGSPVCELLSDQPTLDGLNLVLKGGQMGDRDVFERLARWS